MQIIPRREDFTSFHMWLSKRFQESSQNLASRDFVIIAICCTLWTIWKHRNMFYFDHQPVNPMDAMCQANSIVQKYFSFAISIVQTGRPPPSQIKHNQFWRPPLFYTIKVNCDASFSLDKKKVFAGIIARDKFGNVLFGITKIFAASSPLVAEAIALREAAAVSLNFGVSNVVFECDSLDLVQGCRKESMIGEICGLVQDIL